MLNTFRSLIRSMVGCVIGYPGLMGFNQFGGVVEYPVCVKRQHSTVIGEVSVLSAIYFCELRIIFLDENIAGRNAYSNLHYMNFERRI